MTTGQAKRLAEAIGRTPAKAEEADEGAQAIIKAMQRRGIVGEVRGMPEEISPESAHYQRVLEHLRAENAALEEAEARKQAEAAPSPMSAAQLLAMAINGDRGASPALPLNGAALLQSALNGLGHSGTINGGQQS